MTNRFKARFWKKVLKRGPKDCWPWQGGLHDYGYGQCYPNSVTRYSHRVAWQLTFGKIPRGRCVLHECDNPPCCNPGHLFLGTKADNIRDMIQKGRRPTRNAKITETIVRTIRKLVGKLSQQKIGQRYGLTQSHVSAIMLRKRWKHVES